MRILVMAQQFNIHLLRGIDTLSREVTRSKLFWFLSEKGDTLWSKFIFFFFILF